MANIIIRYCIIIGLLSGVTLQAMAQYTGKVFVDANHNGIFDKGEKTLHHVAVSDGLNVVQTDLKGTFHLPGHSRAHFLFITTPSGYKTDNAYYRPIEEARAEYDFPVYPCRSGIQPDGTHRFIHISDTEIHGKEGNREWTDNLHDYAANERIAFIVHTGDICYEAGLDSHIRLLNTSLMEDTQVFYGIGNHDLVKGAYGEEHFERLYGPAFYSFEVGNVHYVMTPMLRGDFPPRYTKEDVYRWLKNDLAHVSKEKSVIVFNHSLPEDTVAFKYGISDTEYVDLPAAGLKAWLYGHWHVNHIHKHEAAGVYTICTSTPAGGGIDHAPSAFRVLTVNAKGGLTFELRYSYLSPSLHIASLENGQAPVLPSGNIPLSVNAYSSISSVRAMHYWCECEGKKVSSSGPLRQQTDFNWYAEISLPAQWERRKITVVVKAHFNNGEVKQSRHSFLCRKPEKPQIRLGEEWKNLLSSPERMGISRDTFALPLRLAWVRNIGASVYMSAPLVYQRRIFAASVDDNESGKASVTCLDAESGTIYWRYPVRGSVRSSIAAASGRVFVQDVHGYLYAIDATTGALVWEKNLGTGMLPPLDDGLIATSEVLYAGTGQSLCALKTSTGELIWKNKAWTRGEGCVATLSLGQNILIGHANWKGLYANDAVTGLLAWENKDGELKYRSGSAAIVGENLYLLSSRSLFVMDAKSGRIIVRKKLGYSVEVNSTPLVTDTEIIFGTTRRGIVALDRQTMEEKWNFKTNPALIYTSPYSKPPSSTVEASPVLVGNTVFIGASDGTLYALNRTDGKLLWKHHTGVPIFATAAVSGNALYMADFAGNVYGFVSIPDFGIIY